MGCNYYFKPNPEPRCPTCHRSLEETGTIHIGKSSYGWAFSFHGTEKIRSYADWLVVLEAGGEISSQYDEPIPLADFKALVLAKQDGKKHSSYYPSEQNWLDGDGHSFSGYEFS